jgi:hypothetical protein
MAVAAHEVFAFARKILILREEYVSTTAQGNLPETLERHGVKRKRAVSAKELRQLEERESGEPRSRSLASLTDEEIRAIADEWLLNALKEAKKLTLAVAMNLNYGLATTQDWIDTGEKWEQRERLLELLEPDPETLCDLESYPQYEERRAAFLDERREALKEELRSKRVSSHTGLIADDILLHGDIQTNPETENRESLSAKPPKVSLQYVQTCAAALKSAQSCYELESGRMKGDSSQRDATVKRLEAEQETRSFRHNRRRLAQRIASHVSTALPNRPAPISQLQSISPVFPPNPATPALTIHDAVDRYIEEQIRERKWTAHSQLQQPPIYNLFRSIIDPDNSRPLARLVLKICVTTSK